jgi:hypothetical protein
MEEWKDIPDSQYEVSTMGNVRRKGSAKCLKPQMCGRYNGVDIRGEKYNKKQYCHRLVAQAFIPNPNNLPEVDHINNNRFDNHVTNLRWCSRSQNSANTQGRNSKSGLKGVRPDGNKWYSCIGYNDTTIYLGMFNTPEEAHEAYKAKAIELHGEFARW